MQITSLQFPWTTEDPFLFCAFHNDNYPAGDGKGAPSVPLNGRNMGQDFSGKDGWSMYHGRTIPGFPVHPHRGFETITIAKKGMVDHSDSLGSTGRFGDGDVQWMTAGKGVQHSEMFPLIHKDRPNPLEMFQIWLNLPKKSKMAEPFYGMIWREDLKKHIEKDENQKTISVDIISGTVEGIKATAPAPDSWAANPDHEVTILDIYIEAGGSWKLPECSDGLSRNLYFYEGKTASINGTAIKVMERARLTDERKVVIQNTAESEEARFLYLQGKPIREPVSQYGPFVMNTPEEIQEAYSDYQRTQFGGWPWPKADFSHPMNKGRFAKYLDGTEEEK